MVALILLGIPGMKAADVSEFGYCTRFGGVWNTAGNPVGTAYGEALEIPAATAQSFNGCKIVGISVGFGTAAKCDVEVFISTNLQKDPLYSQKATVRPNEFTVVTLDEPYEIVGKRVYVGYKFVSTSTSDSPMAFDYDEANKNSYGNWVSIAVDAGQFNKKWEHYYSNYGNCCVRAVIEGNISGSATVVPTSVELPPLVRPGRDFTSALKVSNTSTALAEEVEVSWTAGSNSGTHTYHFEEGLKAGGSALVNVPMVCDEEGEDVPVAFRITKVNGEDNYDASTELTASLFCSWSYAVRNVLVEKNTGNRCGWCPRGIVGFSRMEEEITDGSFIPVAVHNYNENSDVLMCPSYYLWNNAYTSYSAPRVVSNREGGVFDPQYELLMEKYKAQHTRTFAEIELQTSLAGSYADVSADVRFYKDIDGADYGVGFILTEDGLGPYGQNNNYANSTEPMGGFEKKGGVVMLVYDNVAREIFDWRGEAGLIPSAVKAGSSYPVSRTLSLSNCENPENVKVTAFLTDRKTGYIINSARVKLGKSTGIGDVESDGASPVSVSCSGRLLAAEGDFLYAKVFSLDGLSVAELHPGERRIIPAGVFVIKIVGGNSDGKIFKVIAR